MCASTHLLFCGLYVTNKALRTHQSMSSDNTTTPMPSAAMNSDETTRKRRNSTTDEGAVVTTKKRKCLDDDDDNNDLDLLQPGQSICSVLPPEVLTLIAQFLDDNNDILNLRLTCRMMNDVVMFDKTIILDMVSRHSSVVGKLCLYEIVVCNSTESIRSLLMEDGGLFLEQYDSVRSTAVPGALADLLDEVIEAFIITGHHELFEMLVTWYLDGQDDYKNQTTWYRLLETVARHDAVWAMQHIHQRLRLDIPQEQVTNTMRAIRSWTIEWLQTPRMLFLAPIQKPLCRTRSQEMAMVCCALASFSDQPADIDPRRLWPFWHELFTTLRISNSQETFQNFMTSKGLNWNLRLDATMSKIYKNCRREDYVLLNLMSEVMPLKCLGMSRLPRLFSEHLNGALYLVNHPPAKTLEQKNELVAVYNELPFSYHFMRTEVMDAAIARAKNKMCGIKTLCNSVDRSWNDNGFLEALLSDSDLYPSSNDLEDWPLRHRFLHANMSFEQAEEYVAIVGDLTGKIMPKYIEDNLNLCKALIEAGCVFCPYRLPDMSHGNGKLLDEWLCQQS